MLADLNLHQSFSFTFSLPNLWKHKEEWRETFIRYFFSWILSVFNQSCKIFHLFHLGYHDLFTVFGSHRVMGWKLTLRIHIPILTRKNRLLWAHFVPLGGGDKIKILLISRAEGMFGGFCLKKYFHIIYMVQWLIIHLYIHRTSVPTQLKQYKLTFFSSNWHCT